MNGNYTGDVYGNSAMPGSGDVSAGYGVLPSTNAANNNGNTVTVSGFVDGINNSVYGAYWNAGNADVTNNIVTITGSGSVAGSGATGGVFGGMNESTGLTSATTISDNQVIINTTASVGRITGGDSGRTTNVGNTATVTRNHITIKAGDVIADLANIMGGHGDSGDVTFNTVTIQDSGNVISSGNIIGGLAHDGTVTDNTVYIGKDSNGNGTYTGTVNSHYIAGGGVNDASAGVITERNRVFISSGTVNATTIAGGLAAMGSATNNTVSISGSATVSGNIAGGLVAMGSATNNTVSISTSGKTYSNIYGGMTLGGTGDLFTGNTLNLTADNTITSVRNFETINFDSSGNAGIGTLDTTPTGAASTSKVTLNIGTNNIDFDGVIVGNTDNSSKWGGIEKTGTGTLTLSGDSSTYAGSTTITAGTLSLTSTAILGGNVTTAGAALQVEQGAAINGDLNAAGGTLNFYVPETMGDGDYLLIVKGTAYINGATVNVGIDGNSSPLKAGDQIQLISAEVGLDGDPANNTSDGTGMQGVSLKYEFDITADPSNKKLLATVRDTGPGPGPGPGPSPGPTVNPQTKAFSEARLSQLAFANQGSDLVAGQGLFAALAALDTEARRGKNTTVFGTLSGGSSRYKTGSHSDVTGVSLIAGLTGCSQQMLGKLTLGAFFEYGNANYDSYNSFVNADSVRGKGDTDYTGGGVLAHFEFNPTARGNAWLESSARFGESSFDFKTGEMFDQASGQHAAFASENNYAAAHVGLGYHWKLTKQNGLDFYAQYLWSRQNADTAELTTGETIKFETANSERLRLGSRFVYNLNPHRRAYAGIAWEHEFDGEANASIYGFRLDTPTLTGDTCKLELGLTLQPTKTCPFTRNLGVQGYTGKREGVAGSVEVRYEF